MNLVKFVLNTKKRKALEFLYVLFVDEASSLDDYKYYINDENWSRDEHIAKKLNMHYDTFEKIAKEFDIEIKSGVGVYFKSRGDAEDFLVKIEQYIVNT